VTCYHLALAIDALCMRLESAEISGTRAKKGSRSVPSVDPSDSESDVESKPLVNRLKTKHRPLKELNLKASLNILQRTECLLYLPDSNQRLLQDLDAP
jgi:hypothetical protein